MSSSVVREARRCVRASRDVVSAFFAILFFFFFFKFCDYLAEFSSSSATSARGRLGALVVVGEAGARSLALVVVGEVGGVVTSPLPRRRKKRRGSRD
jgi:uncharacterized oligopeptide transporter (OPT) family protein